MDTITTERRDRAPWTLTVNPEPVHHARNDALEGLLPGRQLREILPEISDRASARAKGGENGEVCVFITRTKGPRVGADGNQPP